MGFLRRFFLRKLGILCYFHHMDEILICWHFNGILGGKVLPSLKKVSMYKHIKANFLTFCRKGVEDGIDVKVMV